MPSALERFMNEFQPEPTKETVFGIFECQEDECEAKTNTAWYLEEINVLTWKCPEDHISRIENFE